MPIPAKVRAKMTCNSTPEKAPIKAAKKRRKTTYAEKLAQHFQVKRVLKDITK